MADDKRLNSLTDGTGVSPLTAGKLFKDFVADFLLTAPAALIAVNVMTMPGDQQGFFVAGTALLGGFIRAGYRALLRWATT